MNTQKIINKCWKIKDFSFFISKIKSKNVFSEINWTKIKDYFSHLNKIKQIQKILSSN